MLTDYIVHQPKPEQDKSKASKQPAASSGNSAQQMRDDKERKPSPLRKTNWFDSDGEGEK